MWTKKNKLCSILAAGLCLSLLSLGCGPLEEEELLREESLFDVLVLKEIKEVKFYDPGTMSVVSKLQLKVKNTAIFGDVTIPSCGFELWRFSQYGGNGGLGPVFVKVSAADYPMACIKTILTVKPGAETTIQLPLPKVVWWYQLQVKYSFLGNKVLYVPFNLPIDDLKSTTPRMIAESDVYPVNGAIQLYGPRANKPGDKVAISGTVRGTIGIPHFALAIERTVRVNGALTVERAYYRVDRYCAVNQCSGILTTLTESSLFKVKLLIARQGIGAYEMGFVNFELSPKEGQFGTAKVVLNADGMQEGMTIPRAESNPWQVQVNLAL